MENTRMLTMYYADCTGNAKNNYKMSMSSRYTIDGAFSAALSKVALISLSFDSQAIRRKTSA